MKRNKYIRLTMLAAGMLAAASCTDFSDYNETPEQAQPMAQQTLWENLQQNSDRLSDFIALVKRTGFDKTLSETGSFTIWAPVNGRFNAAAYEQLDDSTLLAQFVKNHIAKFSHVASGNLGGTGSNLVHMLNGKSYSFEGGGSNYTFGDINVSTVNVPSNNGMLHLLDSALTFYPNLYEYLSLGDNISELAAYFKKYEETRLDMEESEKGPMVDGMQTYVDSVMVTTNTLTRSLNALIQVEDSSYSFLLPTDEAYNKMYEKVKGYYNFIPATVMQDPSLLDKAYSKNASGDKDRNAAKFQKTDKVVTNPLEWQDSLTRRAIVRNLIFSNNHEKNSFLGSRQAGRDGLTADSVVSTTRTVLSNPGELFEDYLAADPIKMSNGRGYLVDSLAMYSWETYCPMVVVQPMRDMVKTFSATSRNVVVYSKRLAEQLLGPGNEEFRYLLVQGQTDRLAPDMFVRLPGVRSTTYDFYCVVLPAGIGVDSMRVTPMNFDLSYCKANGALDNYHFSASGAANPGTFSINTAFMNDPAKIDTLYLGRFTFPVSYSGLGDDFYPSLYISSPVSSNAQRTQYSREFRIYAILLKPVEMVEFEEKNK